MDSGKPIVIATQESHQIPDLSILLPHGLPVPVEEKDLGVVLCLHGVRLVEAPEVFAVLTSTPIPETPADPETAATHEENL